MKRSMRIFAVIGLLLIACNENEENEFPNTDHPLDGVWHLESISDGFNGFTHLEQGEVEWRISVATNRLLVINNYDTTPNSLNNIATLESGDYFFSIKLDTTRNSYSSNDFIILEGDDQLGSYSVYDGIDLLIDQGIQFDGRGLYFTK